MKTVTFYSYKGGVGRSLALSNIAIRLSELKKKVCVLDFDLEAPGLQFKFDNYSKSKPIEKGIVDYIDEFKSTGSAPKSIRNYYIDLIPSNDYFEKIQLFPAGNIDDSSYWKKLSSIDWSDMFYERESRGVQFFLDLKYKIETEIKPDFLLIDSRTGITDIAGITLKLLADEVVILAANNKENIYGSKKIIKSLIDKNNLLLGRIPKIVFILTRLPFTDAPKDKSKEVSVLKSRTLEFRSELSIPDFEIMVIHSDRRLEEKEIPLIGDDYESKGISISNDYLKLFDKLTNGLLTPQEISIFRNKKNAEREFTNALWEVDNAKKIIYFTRAIEFDNTQFAYYLQRGKIYLELKEFEKGEHDLLHAMTLNEDSIEAIDNLASLNFDLKRIGKAIMYADLSIKKSKDNWYPYWIKSVILFLDKKVEDAIAMLSKILDEINPNLDFVLNSRADFFRHVMQYEQAFKDIFRAIEINPDDPLYFATLAEIYVDTGKINEFYLNLNIALSKGITAEMLSSAKDIYRKVEKEERFIDLMTKYSIDINEVFANE